MTRFTLTPFQADRMPDKESLLKVKVTHSTNEIMINGNISEQDPKSQTANWSMQWRNITWEVRELCAAPYK